MQIMQIVCLNAHKSNNLLLMERFIDFNMALRAKCTIARNRFYK